MSNIIHNPAELLGMGGDPALNRFCRACGMAESHITGDAPDFEKFEALASVLRDAVGHPLREKINQTLADALGHPVSLCRHNASSLWKEWVERCLGEGDVRPYDYMACHACRRPRLSVLLTEELWPLGDPLPVCPNELPGWTDALCARLPEDEHPLAWTLPVDYDFVRPDVYHVGLALAKSPAERTLQDRNLLLTQAGRILSRNNTRGTPFFLFGGTVGAVSEFIGYMRGTGYQGAITYFPTDPISPSALAPFIGRYPYTTLGLVLRKTDPPDRIREKLATYAAISPIGRTSIVSEGELPELASLLPE